MPLHIRALHAAPSAALLNEEWILLENTGPNELSSSGWTISLVRGKGQRPSALGTLQPGFVIHPGEKIRLVTGTASKKSQGTPPPDADGVKNYHLFLREAMLTRPGAQVVVQFKQLELARATFDPQAEDGLRAPSAAAATD